MKVLGAVLLCLGMAWPAAGEQVVAGLSQSDVAITASFDGSDILVFGAVRREAPVPEGAPLEVVITVQGPSRPVVVRRKSRVLGIWVNTEAVEVDLAPSFYAIATTGPIDEVLTATEDLRHKVTIPQAIRSVGAPMTIADSQSFTEALIRIRERSGDYRLIEREVGLEVETLFRADFELPANLTEGSYRTRIFLTREGRVVDLLETSIEVRKVGLERWLYNLAQRQPLVYGLLAVVLAVVAGWGASAIFRYIRA